MPSLVNLFKGCVKRFGDLPTRVVRFEFRQIGDVADVVAGAILIYILVVHRLAGDFRNEGERL